MNIFRKYYGLALGTSRFPIKSVDDKDGIYQSSLIVERAIELGINYIDTAHLYSKNAALEAIGLAFRRKKIKDFAVTVKVRYGADFTEKDVFKRIETFFSVLGIEHSDFLHLWTIMSYSEFENIMKKGGLYDGALEAKKQGLVDHICFSTHAPIPDAVKIVESRAFEGVTISFNPLTANTYQSVINAAIKNNVAVAAMNPLAGGLIPENSEFFKSIIGQEDIDLADACMQFDKSYEGIDIVLSGASSVAQLEENFQNFSIPRIEEPKKRVERVINSLKRIDNFCTGCHYCDGCPSNIPISSIMQSFNRVMIGVPKNWTEWYNRSDKYLLDSMVLFDNLSKLYDFVPETDTNPCIDCGLCEKNCTQHLKIREKISELYERTEKGFYSLSNQKTRISNLVVNKGYKKVGLYPNSMQASKIIELYEGFFGEPDFEWVYFNSDPKVREAAVTKVYAPEDIPSLNLDLIIIDHFKSDKIIYDSIKELCKTAGTKLEIFYENDSDIPYIFN
ncbi:MAG: aldo/keto reductase [Oscillospiraceae bacterium]|jgi:predicted aldo/keto reductase-like oxidoreductase|nr:aldo/keto reductase [Oscillospiraceae bacterium]